jgi:hypothetical protein
MNLASVFSSLMVDIIRTGSLRTTAAPVTSAAFPATITSSTAQHHRYPPPPALHTQQQHAHAESHLHAHAHAYAQFAAAHGGHAYAPWWTLHGAINTTEATLRSAPQCHRRDGHGRIIKPTPPATATSNALRAGAGLFNQSSGHSYIPHSPHNVTAAPHGQILAAAAAALASVSLHTANTAGAVGAVGSSVSAAALTAPVSESLLSNFSVYQCIFLAGLPCTVLMLLAVLCLYPGGSRRCPAQCYRVMDTCFPDLNNSATATAMATLASPPLAVKSTYLLCAAFIFYLFLLHHASILQFAHNSHEARQRRRILIMFDRHVCLAE